MGPAGGSCTIYNFTSEPGGLRILANWSVNGNGYRNRQGIFLRNTTTSFDYWGEGRATYGMMGDGGLFTATLANSTQDDCTGGSCNSSGATSANVFYRTDLRRWHGGAKYSVGGVATDITVLETGVDGTIFGVLNNGWDGSQIIVTYFALAKYSDPEPTYSVGSEETFYIPTFNMTFVSPTILNNYISTNFTFINITSDVDLTGVSLEWNGTEEPMVGSGENWFLNKTNILNGFDYFRVVGIDVNNNIGSTNTSWISIIGPPVLTNPTPSNNSYISSIFFQTFSIQVSDENVKNGTLYYLRQNIDNDWQSTDLVSCSDRNPTCSATIDASGIEEGNTVSYYFEVYDQADKVSYNGTATNYLVTTVDRTPPQWSDNVIYPISGVTYAPGQSYQFNITVIDNFAVDKVLLEFFSNTTNTTTNYASTKDGNVYSVNLTDLPAKPDGYLFQWHMYDTAGNKDSTDSWPYVINKAPSQVSLLLNGSDSNITITNGTIVNITGELITGQGDIYLYENDLFFESGASPLIYISNTSTFDIPGTYNITLVYEETENYTGASAGISVVINETEKAIVSSIRSRALPLTGITTSNTLRTNDANPVETHFIMVMTDSDGDGVFDSQDKCPGTILPESVPRGKLLPRHYAEVDGDRIFETAKITKGKCEGDKEEDYKRCRLEVVDSKYTLTDTYGCSCEQILKLKPGKDTDEYKYGCSQETIDVFIKKIGSSTTSTTPITSTSTTPTTKLTTTTIISCSDKDYWTCKSLPNCKWVGDLRTGHCTSK